METIKILYLHNNTPDYLAESLFHGLRSVLGENCVDVPRYDSLYSPLTEKTKSTLRGNAFTLYGLLEDMPQLNEKRNLWQKELKHYDLIVIADIWKLSGLFNELRKQVPLNKLVVIDGSDFPSVFPYASMFQRIKNNPASFFIPVNKVTYFKRELAAEGEAYNLGKFLPYSLRKNIGIPKNIHTINFSIPSQKITKVDSGIKKKLFNRHIVDAEVAGKVNDSFYSAIGSDKHYFEKEKEYYEDLQISSYGITTKRSGWDCLRHYELAANGAVICFKDLDQKFTLCAPHGLDATNSISYKNYDDLMQKINKIKKEEYEVLLANTYQWIFNNTTEKIAQKFIRNSLSTI